MNFSSLTLLAPAALLGLLAIAVPLYLHMRHKPRAQVLRFPALEFLLRAERKRKRRLRVEQWLLMLVRIAVVAFLVFLFARPFLSEGSQVLDMQRSSPLVIVLDDSASMLAGPANYRFWDEAKRRAQELLDKRGSGSPTLLLTASSPAEGHDQRTTEAVRKRLNELKPTLLASTLDLAYQQALDLIEAQNWQGAQVRILTDGSANAWKQLPSQKPKVPVVFDSVREPGTSPHNRGIAQFGQSQGDRNALEVTLHNGSPETLDIPVQLELGTKRGPRQTLRLDAYGRATHRFGLSNENPPYVAVSLPDDDFAFDNKVYFPPRHNQTMRILIVDGDTNPEPVKSESFFFQNALGLEDSTRYGFELVSVTPLGLTEDKISQADVICLLNVDFPKTELLKQALAQGKGIFVSLGPLVDEKAWNGFFEPFKIQIWETKTFPAPQLISPRALDHPLFSGISTDDWLSYLGNVSVSAFRLATLGASKTYVPLSLGDGTPLLLAGDLKPGRLVVWTSTVDLAWSNFPLEFGFVPFVRQVVTYLASHESEMPVTHYSVDQVYAAGLEKVLVPRQLPTAVETLDLKGPKPGLYSLSEGNKQGYVQVMLDPAESEFKGFEERMGETGGEDPLASLGFQRQARADLGPTVQWFLFFLILVETLVAARVSLGWGGR